MSSVRIFDRNNYQKKTLDTFEILAAYFVDIYYNHLYIEAKKLRTNNSVKSITEGYKHTLNAFLLGVENPKLYKKTLVGIHSFFISSGFTSMSFTECIERITGEFIPSDYYASVSKQQKVSILKLVICQSNKSVVEKIVRKFLSLIIDNHDDADNIRILQDEYIDLLMVEREGIYHKFISTQAKNSKTANINIVMVESMQNEIKTLCKEKFELKKITTSLKKIILSKEYELREKRTIIETLTNNNNELKNEISESSLNKIQNVIPMRQRAVKKQVTAKIIEPIIEVAVAVSPPLQESEVSEEVSEDDANDIKSDSDYKQESIVLTKETNTQNESFMFEGDAFDY